MTHSFFMFAVHYVSKSSSLFLRWQTFIEDIFLYEFFVFYSLQRNEIPNYFRTKATTNYIIILPNFKWQSWSIVVVVFLSNLLFFFKILRWIVTWCMRIVFLLILCKLQLKNLISRSRKVSKINRNLLK